MKTVIIGGSAHSTPALFETPFALAAPRFEFTLVGPSPARLAAVSRAIEIVGARHGITIAARVATEPLEAVIAEADVILIQFRIGAYAARASDETFPHRYGTCGDEGLGPGGLASAWRTWPELHSLLATIARYNSRAFVLLLTSPLGILVRCARLAFPSLNVYGICELPWTALTELCAAAGTNPDRAKFAYTAVNHLGWFSDVRGNGATIVAADEVHPLKYVRLYDAPAAVLCEQLASAPRAHTLAALADHAYAVYASGTEAAVLAALRRRPTPWYAHAVAPFLCSLAGTDTSVTYFLSAPNAGACPQFAADDILEFPFVVRDGKLQRRETLPFRRRDIIAKVRRLVKYERFAADAVLHRNQLKIAAALRAHPFLDGLPLSAQLVADVVAAPAATSVR
jgi:6-phospho-beta-glucosidase